MPTSPLTRRSIVAQAWPIMLGQTTVPLVGLVDTWVIGRTGDAAALAGVALGTTVVNFIFWSFGFLRMGMTGMTAQAQGAGDDAEVRAMLLRGGIAGLGIGTLIFVAQIALIPVAFALLAGGEALDTAARAFTAARFFGAPAGLAVFAITGWLLGLGRTRSALALQIVMNVANIALDLYFVRSLGLGAAGVGYGTTTAEWIALITGMLICWRILGRNTPVISTRLFDRDAIRRLFAVNANIMIRTVALLALFAWFTNAGARLGPTTLAANHVLLQFVSVAAFVLDGFAFTAESRVGHAIGQRSRPALIRAIRLTGEFSAVAGLVFCLAIWLGGAIVIDALTTNTEIRTIATAMLPLVALVPLIGMPAWLLDGVFMGAAAGRPLRNAALIATALYVVIDLALRGFGETGLWIAFLLGYVLRAVALGAQLPALLRTVANPPAAS
ncbi:MAG: MATE family efflux transporter [Sphingomonas bacterium]|nr:MATE family efflux transporter [Sphingomonas bacterium]